MALQFGKADAASVAVWPWRGGLALRHAGIVRTAAQGEEAKKPRRRAVRA